MDKLRSLKWLVYIALSLIFLSYLFSFVFYSNIIANNSQIIKIRDKYQSILYKVIQLSQRDKHPIVFNPIYSITVREWNGLYYYTFTGKFAKADLEQAVIYIKSNGGRIYSFKVSKNFVEQQEDFKLENLGFVPLTDRVDTDNLPLSESSQIKITWEDKRTLSEILKDYLKDKNRPLNANSTLFFNITKRK